MKKILVFGASGDTGSYFVQYFLEHADKNEYEILASGTKSSEYLDELGRLSEN